jgi:hypothetical protein
MFSFDLATHARFSFVSLPLKHVSIFYFLFLKKIGREDADFFFDSFSNIACVFA